VAGPCDVPIVGEVCGAVGSAVGAVAKNGFEAAARSMGEGADQMLQITTSAWMAVPSGTATQQDTVRWLQGDLLQLTMFVAVIGFIVAGAKTALSHRTDSLRLALFGAFRLMTVTAAGGTILYLVLRLGDDFAQWIVADSMGGQLDTSNIFSFAKAGVVNSGILLILGFLAIIGSIVQIGLLLVRSGLLVVLAGAWPLSAAASMTAAGEHMWKKLTGWIVAFALYKPAAAIVYAVAFRLIQGGDSANAGEQLLALVQGVVLLFVAILALPSLLRLVVPATTAVGGASAGGAIAGAAVLATGAVAVPALAGGLAPAMAAGAAGANGSNGAAGLASGNRPPGANGSAGGARPGGGDGPGSGPAGGAGPSGNGPKGASPGAPSPGGASPAPGSPPGTPPARGPSGAGSGAAGFATGAAGVARGAQGAVEGEDRT
jgi:type IV secretion system protein TrbL